MTRIRFGLAVTLLSLLIGCGAPALKQVDSDAPAHPVNSSEHARELEAKYSK